jgi:hypothetical protein
MVLTPEILDFRLHSRVFFSEIDQVKIVEPHSLHIPDGSHKKALGRGGHLDSDLLDRTPRTPSAQIGGKDEEGQEGE